MISNNTNKTISINGVVKNPTVGLVSDANIKLGNSETTSNSDGEFSINTVLDYDLNIVVGKMYDNNEFGFAFYKPNKANPILSLDLSSSAQTVFQ